MSLISMHGAWLSFSDAPLLDNAELHIEDNERVCLVGRNGAGKSTLMKILNREQGLDDGRIIYEQDLIVARLQQDPPVILRAASMTLSPKVSKNKQNTSSAIMRFPVW